MPDALCATPRRAAACFRDLSRVQAATHNMVCSINCLQNLLQCPRAAAVRAPQHVPVACRRGSPKPEQPRSLAGPANFHLLRQEYNYSLILGMHGPHIALMGSSRQGYACLFMRQPM